MKVALYSFFKSLFTVALLFVCTSGWAQTDFLVWTFDNSTPLTASTNLTGQTATISSSGLTTATTGCTGNGYGGSAWVIGDYIQILAPTNGYNINTLKLSIRSSNTGPAKLDVQYSSTGITGTFVTIGQIQSTNASTCTSGTIDFSAITALNNNANVVIRLVAGNYGEADGNPNTGNPAAAGTLRIDDVVISGTLACTTPTQSFATASVTKTLGDAPFTNIFTPNSTGAVTYSSSNTGVATVNVTTGEVTLVGPGTANITASTAASSPYCAATLSFPLTVNPSSYTLTYDGNGNSGGTPPAGGSHPAGGTVTVSYNTGSLIKTCATFNGWNTAANGSGTSYAPGAPLTLNADTILYAQWTSTLKTVSFNANGGTGSMTAQTACAPEAIKANAYTRAGYTFAGWNTAANGSGTAYSDGALYDFTADVPLYAQWTANNNTITFNGNGATAGSTPVQTLATDATASLNLNGYTRTGYTFAGWATTAGGTVAYGDGAAYTMGTANVTLYAKWTANTYYIIFNKNDAAATGTMTNQTIAYEVTANLFANGFAKPGYAFKEWNTVADGSGTSYANSAAYTMSTLGDKTLYAQWEVYTGPCGFESFTNSTATASYGDGSFVGDMTTWSYIASRDESTYGINGKGIMLRQQSSGSKLTSATVSGGIGSFTCSLRKAFTGSGDRQVELFVNGVSRGKSIKFGSASGTDTTVYTFTIDNINITGNVIVEIRNITGNQVVVDDISWTCYTPCTSPTTQAANFTATNILATTATANWTRGNGDAVLVLAKANAPVDAEPVSGTAYTANTAFGSGTEIGTGNFVVYSGTGTTVNLTGLTGGSTYHFAVFEYNTLTNCYNLVSPATGRLTTLKAPETPTAFTKICTTATTQQLSWNTPEGGADGYLLVVRQGATPHSVSGINAQSQAFDLNYGAAPTFGSTTPNSRIVYRGTGTNVTVTGLSNNTSYTFALYAYNANGSTAVLYSGVTTTTQVTGVPDVNFPAATPGDGTAQISWLNPSSACFDEVMAVVTTAAGITFLPAGDGSAYTANAVYSAPNQVVYKGAGNSVLISGLTNGTTYYVELFVRNGTSWSKGEEIAVTPNNNFTVFKPGELFFVGYDGQYEGSGVNDEYLIATLTDIKPGTEFSFVNSRYEAGAAANVRTDKWGGSGDFAEENPGVAKIKYNGSTAIASGSVLRIRTSGTAAFFSSVAVIGTDNVLTDRTADFSASLPFGTDTVPNISTSGFDQIYLVQGDFVSDGDLQPGEANYILHGTLLHGLTNRTGWVPLSSANSGGTKSTDRTSRLPAFLECFNLEGSGSTTNSGYYQNDKLHSGSFREIISAVNSSPNWTYSTGRYNLEPANFSSGRAGRSFVRTAGKPDGTWVSTSDTNWFYCSNWESLRVPDRFTDVITGSTGTVKAVINTTAAFSDLYSDTAEVRNLSIIGNSVEMGGSSPGALIIYGDLSVTGSGSLDLSNVYANVDIYGDWNSAAGVDSFKEGFSRVRFLGDSPQIINGNDHANPEIFYEVELHNDFDTEVSNNLVAKGNLTVNAGKNVRIAPGDYIQAGKKLVHLGTETNFTIENDGQLLQVDDVQNTGKITVKRNMTFTDDRKEYNYLASPVEGQHMKMLFGAASNTRYVLVLKESTNLFVNAATADYNIIGKGFAVKEAIDTYTDSVAHFKGKPVNGSHPVTVTKTSAGRGWNLIGNPYASNLDLKLYYEQNNANMLPEFRFWDNRVNNTYVQYGGAYNGYSYAIYNALSDEGNPAPGGDAGNNTGTPGTPTEVAGLYRYAKVGQGFLIRAVKLGDHDLNFRNTQRTVNQPDRGFFGKSEVLKDRYRLQLISPSDLHLTNTVVYFEGGSNSFGLEDSRHPSSGASDAFYSLAGTDKTVINGRAAFEDTDVIALGNKHYVSGNYTIRAIDRIGVFANGQSIYLKDKALNIITDLTAGDYAFTTEAGDFTNRFEIVYKPAVVLAADDASRTLTEVYRDGSDFVVRSDRTVETVEVFDGSGRLLITVNGSARELHFGASPLTDGMYVVKARLKGGDTFTKKIRK